MNVMCECVYVWACGWWLLTFPVCNVLLMSEISILKDVKLWAYLRDLRGSIPQMNCGMEPVEKSFR